MSSVLYNIFIRPLRNGWIKIGEKLNTSHVVQIGFALNLVAFIVAIFLRTLKDEEERKKYSRLSTTLFFFNITYLTNFAATYLDWVLNVTILATFIFYFGGG